MDIPAIPHRVLIVEDNHDIGQLLVELLGIAGYTTELVRTGQAAITVLQRGPPLAAAIVIDYTLGDMTATEVLQATVADRGTMAVVLVTARIDGAALAQLLNVCSYLRKPFDPRHLLEELAICIAGADRNTTG